MGGSPRESDYAEAGRWLARPERPERPVDVFYLYPTAWVSTELEKPAYCPADDPRLRALARKFAAWQTRVFAGLANIFAPFYSQVNTALLRRPAEEHPALLAGPMGEAAAAFRHYLARDNHGRPFLLAGHSQGADVLFRSLLGQALRDRPELNARLVAAYLLGFAVTEDLLAAHPHLKFAQGRRDLGVIVSYNTEARGLAEVNPFPRPGALAINPVSWTRTSVPAPAGRSLGADLSRFKGPDHVPGFTGARLNLRRGTVECDLPADSPFQAPGGFLPPGVFHDGDYAFYHYDLRQNARDRIAAFLGRAEPSEPDQTEY
ncbi:hypothetical protein FACS189460_1730 [Deltaproteobacteria bacterium]|nr:hypothetical protein FACS189460_1730 [Deltaproteobacteria bacterium]